MKTEQYPHLQEQNGLITIDTACRRYTVAGSPLFSSVLANGHELLAAPMAIGLYGNGERQELTEIENLPTLGEDGSVTVLSTMQSKLFFLNTELRVEEDGCCFIRICLMPRGYTVPQVMGVCLLKTITLRT